LSRRVEEEFGNLQSICRIRDRLLRMAIGPPENQEVLRVLGPISERISHGINRIINLYDLMAEMASEIREINTHLLRHTQ